MKMLERDVRLRRISALGKASGMSPASADPRAAIDQLQRRCAELEDAVAQLYGHVFEGPIFGPAGNLFRIDTRSGTTGYNLIASADSAKDGLPATTAGFVIFRHGLGYVLDRYVVVHWALANPGAFNEALGTFAARADGPPERAGGMRIYSFDDSRTVFQLDDEAVQQQVLAWVVCYSSAMIPTNKVSPEATGAARGQNGYILATNVGTTV